MALSLNPHCLSVPGEPGQRDAHQEGRSPEGAGPGEAEGPRKEESSSSGDQSSSEASVGAGPEHLGTGLWEVGAVPVGQVQLPGSQAVVVMGALGQEGQCLVVAAAAATAAAAAASGAAPVAAAGSEVAMTSGIWDSPSPDWGLASGTNAITLGFHLWGWGCGRCRNLFWWFRTLF